MSGAAGMTVGGFPLPTGLAEARDPGAVAWLEGLAPRVAAILERWGLRAGAPFEPGGSSAWVAPVVDDEGRPWALKVAYAHEEARDEAAGLLAWQGRGAAHLERCTVQEETAYLLMEHVRPGEPLAQMLTWPERDEVTTTLMRRLWAPPSDLAPVDLPGAAGTFRPLSEMCDAWALEAEERGSDSLPTEVVEQGLAWMRELPREWDGEAVLLATDLNPWNVLSRGTGDDRSWALIDPKPYVGDPHYDLLQHMFNDPERLTSDPSAFAIRMATLAGLDPDRTRRWLLARCVQEEASLPEAATAARVMAADLGL